MALASAEDVKRVLGLADDDTSLDAAIDAALEAADEYVQRKLRRAFSASGFKTETFYDVREDGLLFLEEDAQVVTSVVDADALDLRHTFQGGNEVRLNELDTGVEDDPRLYTHDGPKDSRFSVVTVTYVPTTTVPAPVREAVALIAAEFTPEAVQRDAEGNIIGRIIQEKIGDYGYLAETESLKPGVKGDRIKKALWLLRPYFRRRIYVV